MRIWTAPLAAGALALLAWLHGVPHAAPWSGATASTPDASLCAAQWLEGRSPTGPAALVRDARPVCAAGWAALESPTTRTPVWSAEALDPGRLAGARATKRDSDFHEEESLPASMRAGLDDYRRSGFDRGHLAPSGDMRDPSSQRESFSLANVVPQARRLNREAWADLEADVRSLGRRRDRVYVVTGALGSIGTVPDGRVVVPAVLWKAVASPGEGAAVWTADNRDDAGIRSETVESFRARTGVDPFPALDGEDRSRILRLR